MKTRTAESTVCVREGRAEQVGEARAQALAILDGSPFPDRDRRLIALAVEEAVGSILQRKEGNGNADASRVSVHMDLDPTRLRVEISDTQNVFDIPPLPTSEACDAFAAHEKRLLHLWLVLRVMDEVKYVYRRGMQNSLVLVRFTP